MIQILLQNSKNNKLENYEGNIKNKNKIAIILFEVKEMNSENNYFYFQCIIYVFL